ncbi:MAG: hypothetical protein ACJA0Z_004339 [Halioglobus sp.]|jgi:hypothetical protein
MSEPLTNLIGHQFPGGEYLIEHWENFLLTDCTGADLMASGVVHPIALFHVPIIGAQTSIAEMFALGQAESDFSISIESYDWHFHSPLKENVRYSVTGGVIDVQLGLSKGARLYDLITFRFEIADDNRPVATTEVAWHYNRSSLK